MTEKLYDSISAEEILESFQKKDRSIQAIALITLTEDNGSVLIAGKYNPIYMAISLEKALQQLFSETPSLAAFMRSRVKEMYNKKAKGN